MRLTKFNEETGKYEYIAKPMEYVEYRALTLAALQKLGEFEDKAEMGAWISVEDRLPEQERGEDWFCPNSYVLCATSDKKVFAGNYCHDNKCFWYRDSLHPLKDITHWMPLPEPPKMKGADDEQR